METVMCTRHPFHAVAVFAASVAASAMAAPLSPAAGDRVVQSAAEIARNVLQQRFSHLLESEDGFLGLDQGEVRVVFMEPDAFTDCPGRRSGNVVRGTGWQSPVPIGNQGLWSNGWATPQPCTGCQ